MVDGGEPGVDSRDEGLQRYGDLTVFKMAAVRHLGFVKFEFFNGLRG